MTANVSQSPSVPESLAGLVARAASADGQPPFSDQSLVELARGERELVEVEHGLAVVGAAVVGADEFELVVDPDGRGHGVGTALVERVLTQYPAAKSAWAHGDHPASRTLAARFGFESVRTLLQLRAPVGRAAGRVPAAGPIPTAGRVPAERMYRDRVGTKHGLDTPPSAAPDQRAFRPGTDDAAWLDLNARAFAGHPEQGRLTQRDLDDRKAEPWFDDDDFLVLWDGDRMIGFCWLKVEGDIGEFYAVGVDPERQGEGLGRILMDVGFERLAAHGIRTAALYVEADNEPALALYRRYGFEQHTIDVRYRRPLDRTRPSRSSAT
jgi:mycothiol synthase